MSELGALDRSSEPYSVVEFQDGDVTVYLEQEKIPSSVFGIVCQRHVREGSVEIAMADFLLDHPLPEPTESPDGYKIYRCRAECPGPKGFNLQCMMRVVQYDADGKPVGA